MSDSSSIEWTDATWNPVRGCTKVSPGCKHCYAETFAERFRGVAGNAYEQGFEPRLAPNMLHLPLTWAKPRRIFVNSMSDLFLEYVPDDYIVEVARAMEMANWHTYQVLTKRAERMRQLLETKLAFVADKPHIWWGVSAENREHGLPRIAELKAAPARVRFLSIEPLLEDIGELAPAGIHWVIVGGESGPKSRPMRPAWVRSIREQCGAARVPFFFKQWGGVRKKKNGRLLDGREHNDMPAIVMGAAPSRIVRAAMVAEIEARARRWPTGALVALRSP